MRLIRAGKLTKVRDVWRRAPRRRRQAVIIAVAIALPGSITAGATAGMLPMGANLSSDVLDGILAVEDDAALGGFLDPEHLRAVPVGASSVAEPVRAVLASQEVIETLDANGIPSVAADAYMEAADRLAADDPTCGLRWTLLAAIGRVESNHGRFGGAQLRDDGYGTKPIRGIPLDGRPNVALILDTDGGDLDGDTTYDRAVGPMQVIPSTWTSIGGDADGNGRRDPDNIFDAAAGAGVYLCRGDADLRDVDARARAVRRYNNADEYVRVVLNLAEMYEAGDVDLLPSIGLPPRELPPPPRPTPAPPVTAPDPETPLTPSRQAAPAPEQPEVTDGPAPPPATTSPQPPPTSVVPAPAPTVPPPTPTPPPTPAPSPTTTTMPAPPPATMPDDTVPPTTSTTVPDEPPADTPDEPVVTEPDPAEVEEPAEPPAAVGWAPAMREVVVQILEEASPEAEPTGPATDEPSEGPAQPAEAPPAESTDAPPVACPPADRAADPAAGPDCPPPAESPPSG